MNPRQRSKHIKCCCNEQECSFQDSTYPAALHSGGSASTFYLPWKMSCATWDDVLPQPRVGTVPEGQSAKPPVWFSTEHLRDGSSWDSAEGSQHSTRPRANTFTWKLLHSEIQVKPQAGAHPNYLGRFWFNPNKIIHSQRLRLLKVPQSKPYNHYTEETINYSVYGHQLI